MLELFTHRFPWFPSANDIGLVVHSLSPQAAHRNLLLVPSGTEQWDVRCFDNVFGSLDCKRTHRRQSPIALCRAHTSGKEDKQSIILLLEAVTDRHSCIWHLSNGWCGSLSDLTGKSGRAPNSNGVVMSDFTCGMLHTGERSGAAGTSWVGGWSETQAGNWHETVPEPLFDVPWACQSWQTSRSKS
jgi:hypothetical protein